MRGEKEFATAFDGIRARHGHVALSLSSSDVEDEEIAGFHNPKVGFIVSKKVGNSVIRHRITRQFRHIVRSWIDKGMLNDGEYLVVRAFPGCAGVPSSVLAHDMANALKKCRAKKEQV
ncbi:MAG: ribonuclease P protein component [Actinomycetaceae bacterium]|nr:ribonuclease P protein component [Actinomycetaceae bacterium]